MKISKISTRLNIRLFEISCFAINSLVFFFLLFGQQYFPFYEYTVELYLSELFIKFSDYIRIRYKRKQGYNTIITWKMNHTYN